MDEKDYGKRNRQRAARALQKETGIKYTTCLREVEKMDVEGYTPVTVDELNNYNFLKEKFKFLTKGE